MREYFVWLLKLITILVLVLFVVPAALVGTAVVLGNGEGVQKGGKNVAVIELTGEISDSKEIVHQLYKQAKNDSVAGIVLRIDSPGGGVGASQDIYSAVKTLKAKKPIVASMGGTAASGGLYSALGASKIFAQPGTLTGSIGVIMQIPNFTKVTNTIGVNMVTIKSGRMKDAGNPFREMTPEETQYFETTLAQVHMDFIKAVAESRNIPAAEVEKFADGRVLTGAQAKDLKLVDEFGDVYEAARAVFDLRKEPLKDGEIPSLYYPGDKLASLREVLAWVRTIPKMFSPANELKFLSY